MTKELLKQIQAQFDRLPKQIEKYIRVEFHDFYDYIHRAITTPLANFSNQSQKRWQDAEKKYNVKPIYALPTKIFNKIEKQNTEDFIKVWNQVLKFIWNNTTDFKKRNKLFLLVRTHLISDYGYFDIVDTNKLYKVNNEQT
ncbi:hypothetical protein LCGC14_1583850 [marine sediment metagenome]|uniref:Uncharacterized protein n=1 Tax=marine sediment metagenome TaxID=412755 RepID=A0A0F9IG47_9ZZZZ